MRTGIYATLFVTRGHSYDMHSATWYGMDNAMDFWEDVLKLEPDQVVKQFNVTHQTCLVLWTWRKLADETNVKNTPKIC